MKLLSWVGAVVVAGLLPSSATAYTVGGGYAASDYVTGFPSAVCYAGPQPVQDRTCGPEGIIGDPAGDLFAFDAATNELYRFPPGGGSAPSHQLSPENQNGAADLAYDKSGRLYITGFSDAVQEINPSTGAVIRTVASGLPPDARGMATDPVSGDLFITTGYLITRISNFGSGPGTVTTYATVPATPGTSAADGIAITAGGTMFVAQGSDIWRISGTNTSSPGTVTHVGAINEADGIAVPDSADPINPPFVLVNRNDGHITELDLGTGALTDILTGGTRGDFMAVGYDGCVYATQTDRVIKITNADGSCSFEPTAPNAPPDVLTDPASNVTDTGATLNGRVNPNSSSTTFRFDWGTTTSYGNAAPASPAAVGSDAAAHSESQTITGLSPGTTYHYRIEATNAGGTRVGPDQTFQTAGEGSFAGAVAHVILGSLQFDIKSFLWGPRYIADPAGTHSLHLVKPTDMTTPALLLASLRQTAYPSATVEVFRPGTRSIEATYTLTDVAVSQFSSSLGEDRATLSFRSYKEALASKQQASADSTCKQLEAGMRPLVQHQSGGCVAVVRLKRIKHVVKLEQASEGDINRALKTGGFKASFHAQINGNLEVGVTTAHHKPKPLPHIAVAARATSVAIAHLSKTFKHAGSYQILVRLTKKGRAILGRLLTEIKAGNPPNEYLVVTLTFAVE